MKHRPTERLSADDLSVLAARARGGDVAARNEIVEANLGLVGRMARQRARRSNDHHERYWELFQGGAIGLIRAAERFDPARGPIAGHASHWIRRDMDREGSMGGHANRPGVSSVQVDLKWEDMDDDGPLRDRDRREASDVVAHLMRFLTEAERAVVLARHRDGLSRHATAEALAMDWREVDAIEAEALGRLRAVGRECAVA